MELASHGPIQIGRYRSRPVSLRITTWRLESMCTRTLSTTISISSSSMASIIPRQPGRQAHPAGAADATRP